jgi:hypothetical protein
MAPGVRGFWQSLCQAGAKHIKAAGPGRGAGPRCSDFWRPGKTGAVAWWVVGRREASGLPGPARGRTDFGGAVRAEVSARP